MDNQYNPHAGRGPAALFLGLAIITLIAGACGASVTASTPTPSATIAPTIAPTPTPWPIATPTADTALEYRRGRFDMCMWIDRQEGHTFGPSAGHCNDVARKADVPGESESLMPAEAYLTGVNDLCLSELEKRAVTPEDAAAWCISFALMVTDGEWAQQPSTGYIPEWGQ